MVGVLFAGAAAGPSLADRASAVESGLRPPLLRRQPRIDGLNSDRDASRCLDACLLVTFFVCPAITGVAWCSYTSPSTEYLVSAKSEPIRTDAPASSMGFIVVDPFRLFRRISFRLFRSDLRWLDKARTCAAPAATLDS